MQCASFPAEKLHMEKMGNWQVYPHTFLSVSTTGYQGMPIDHFIITVFCLIEAHHFQKTHQNFGIN